ncbi:Transposon-encoded protein TnpW, partial [Dysosmobacter welbionis]
RQGLRILSIPAGQQVLKPFVPARVCHPVADHYYKASRLQRGTGHIRSRRPAPQ